ncbi:MAG: hypothetical protein IT293_10635 [Deltaproteobacteria bacterium]|nr:hypothetical protein [Deltaproteobacteria bacterium]
MPLFLSRAALAALVFGVLLAVYSSSRGPLPTWDAYANVFPALSLVNDGDFVLAPTEIPFLFDWSLPASGRRLQVPVWDRMVIDGRPAAELYREGKLRPEGSPYYFVVRTPTGEYVGSEPPGTAVVAAPFYAALALPDVARSLRDVRPLVEKNGLVAAVLTAATAAILFLTAARFLDTGRALLVAAIFGLGSCAWSLGSQALWAQAGMQPFLALGIDQFLRIRDRRGHALVAGLALGAAVACRSTSLVVLAALGLHLLATDRKSLVLVVAGALAPLAGLAAYNLRYFGSPLVEAHALMGPAVALRKTGVADLWQTPLWEGALGLLASPGRGLLVYSPVLVLAFVGAWRVVRGRADRAFLPIVAAAAAIMVVRFKWFDWWGGYSYGYRPLMDAIVPFAVLLIPALAAARPTALRRAAVAAALAWSVFVQWVGTAYDSDSWDRHGGFDRRVTRSIDEPRWRERLWSIGENPIVFYWRHRAEAVARREASLAEFARTPFEVRRPTP